MMEWQSVDRVPDLEAKQRTPERIAAQKDVERFASVPDKCWRMVYDDWESSTSPVNREIDRYTQMLRTEAKQQGRNIIVKKRKDSIYMIKEQ